LLPSYPQDQKAIDKFEGLSKPPGAEIAPSAVTLSVVNGTYKTGEEGVVASRLASLGYRIVGTGTSTPVGPISQTIVYYSRGHLLEAERVLQSLGGMVSMAEGPTRDGADVMVVTGSKFSVKVRGHHVHHARPTATTIPNPYPVLSAASSAVQPLPPYDPRACPNS